MIRSRATATAISHQGISPIYASVTNTVASNSLSAMGSSAAPRSLCQPKRLARKPSATSEIAAAPNKTIVASRRRCANVQAVGTTRMILSPVMRFGSWRRENCMAALPAQLKALNSAVARANGLQPAVQSQRVLQRIRPAAGNQVEPDGIAAQGLHIDVGHEGERFKVRLNAGIVLEIVDAAHLDAAAGRVQTGIGVGGAVHTVQGAGEIAAPILEQKGPVHDGGRAGVGSPADQRRLSAGAAPDLLQGGGRGIV